MAKLIYNEGSEYENVLADKASPNGVRLVTSYVQVELWRFRLNFERRYHIRRIQWNERSDYLNGDKSSAVHEYSLNFIHTEASAIRSAIGEIDDYVSSRGLSHADMSDHPAYRDVAPAPLMVTP